jgi:2,3-bisphosphoglycerate-dependent phosphoglycerate mutase
VSTNGTLVLVRHGESTANAAHQFTGLIDVDLTDLGVRQAREAARLLDLESIVPDVVFISPLARARRTAEVIAGELGIEDMPVVASWRLEARDYGSLSGQVKHEVSERYGPELYFVWRRTLLGRPPAALPEQVAGWKLVSTRPPGTDAPGVGETLQDVIDRVRPCWDEELVPLLRSGRCVLVVAHGNSLRALCSIVDDLSGPEVEELNIPACQPLRYDVTSGGQPVPRGGRYLDVGSAHAAAAEIAAEGGE